MNNKPRRASKRYDNNILASQRVGSMTIFRKSDRGRGRRAPQAWPHVFSAPPVACLPVATAAKGCWPGWPVARGKSGPRHQKGSRLPPDRCSQDLHPAQPTDARTAPSLPPLAVWQGLFPIRLLATDGAAPLPLPCERVYPPRGAAAPPPVSPGACPSTNRPLRSPQGAATRP